MPRLDILQDPRNMQKEDIIEFLNQVYAQQEAHGVADAFRFSHYIGRNNELHEAQYPSLNNGGVEVRKKSTKRKKRKG
jgi:hypothetical protein